MGKSIRQAESIRIDSHCRIVMKNFDSVPQLQRLISYTRITVLQDRMVAHMVAHKWHTPSKTFHSTLTPPQLYSHSTTL